MSDKEEEVRQALGVEREYTVTFTIPTTGFVTLHGICVMANDEKDAAKKAMDVVNSPYESDEVEECDSDQDYAPSEEWEAEVE